MEREPGAPPACCHPCHLVTLAAASRPCRSPACLASLSISPPPPSLGSAAHSTCGGVRPLVLPSVSALCVCTWCCGGGGEGKRVAQTFTYPQYSINGVRLDHWIIFLFFEGARNLKSFKLAEVRFTQHNFVK